MTDIKSLVIEYLTKSQENLEKVIEALKNLVQNNDTLTYNEMLDYMNLTFHGSNLREFIHSTKNVWDNVPYENIDEYVNEDLSKYDQEHPAPLSLTITLEDGSFRHYELGACVGYLLYGSKNADSNYYHVMLAEIHEDDEHWFAPSTPLHMNAAWMKGTINTLQRAEKWYKEHIKQCYENGKYHTEFLKPIEYEEIFKENGESACPVLGGPEL